MPNIGNGRGVTWFWRAMGRAGVKGKVPEAEASKTASLGDEVAVDLRGLLLAADILLGAVVGPALVVSCNGQILRANVSARTALTKPSDSFRQSLSVAVNASAGQGGAVSGKVVVGPTWYVSPLRTVSGQIGFLAILHTPTSPEYPLPAVLLAASRRWKLTPRQTEVLELVGRGLTNELIADVLKIGKSTVEFHLSAIFDKAGVSNRATLIVQATEMSRENEDDRDVST